MTDMSTPETYRGIKVPPELANRAHHIEYAMWKLAVVGVLDTVVPMLEAFESEDPCRIDHNGDCQEHWFGGDGPCPVGVLKDFLDLARYDECVFVVEGIAGTTLHWCFRHRPKGVHTDRQNLVKISDLPRISGVRKCVQCGREIKEREL